MRARAQASTTFSVEVDSAGTHSYHIGSPPDSRTQATGILRGYDLSALRARKITHDDFARFDHILAMDLGHLHQLRCLCPPEHQHKLAPFLSEDVPDPYYGTQKDFMHVLDLVEEGVQQWLARLTSGTHRAC